MNIAKNMEAIFVSFAIASLAMVSVSAPDSADAPDNSVAAAPATAPASAPVATVAPLQV